MRYTRRRHRVTGPTPRSRVFRSGLILALLAAGAAAVPAPARAQGAAGAVLDPPPEPLVATTFRATGRDDAAPRALVLWRFDGERLERLAESRSGVDGRFDFGLQPLPLVRAEFGVTGPGEAPDPATFRRYERAVPAPVVASEERDADGTPRTLLVLTARAEGELRLYDAGNDRLLARLPVAGAPGPGTPIELDRWLPVPAPAELAIEHRLADGRVSPRERWRLAPGEPAAANGP